MDGSAYSPDLSPRYTQRHKDQAARKTPEIKRPFYQAGEKIDGSAIQHCPGSEIMVVDFDKDEALKN